MSLSGDRITLVGLVKIELPERTIRLCDGAFVYFGGEKYVSEDPVFGSIGAVDELEAAMGDAAEDARLVFRPREQSTPAELKNKAHQNSRARFWMGGLDADGKTVSSAEQLMDGLVDFTVLRYRDKARELEVSFIGRAEKLFLRQEGNTLNPRFHQSIWPGEKGLNNVGAKLTIAWGVGSPRGVSSFGGGSFGGGSAGGFGAVQMQ